MTGPMNHGALRDSTRCRMPQNDPHDQTDPAGESFDDFNDEAANPTDQGADSADNSDASLAESGDVDQTFSKIDKPNHRAAIKVACHFT